MPAKIHEILECSNDAARRAEQRCEDVEMWKCEDVLSTDYTY
jgi:hypothetical protein